MGDAPANEILPHWIHGAVSGVERPSLQSSYVRVRSGGSSPTSVEVSRSLSDVLPAVDVSLSVEGTTKVPSLT